MAWRVVFLLASLQCLQPSESFGPATSLPFRSALHTQPGMPRRAATLSRPASPAMLLLPATLLAEITEETFAELVDTPFGPMDPVLLNTATDVVVVLCLLLGVYVTGAVIYIAYANSQMKKVQKEDDEKFDQLMSIVSELTSEQMMATLIANVDGKGGFNMDALRASVATSRGNRFDRRSEEKKKKEKVRTSRDEVLNAEQPAAAMTEQEKLKSNPFFGANSNMQDEVGVEEEEDAVNIKEELFGGEIPAGLSMEEAVKAKPWPTTLSGQVRRYRDMMSQKFEQPEFELDDEVFKWFTQGLTPQALDNLLADKGIDMAEFKRMNTQIAQAAADPARFEKEKERNGKAYRQLKKLVEENDWLVRKLTPEEMFKYTGSYNPSYRGAGTGARSQKEGGYLSDKSVDFSKKKKSKYFTVE